MSRVASNAPASPTSDADHHHAHPLADDEPNDSRRRGAKRDAHADLMGAPRHGVADHAIDADRREH